MFSSQKAQICEEENYITGEISVMLNSNNKIRFCFYGMLMLAFVLLGIDVSAQEKIKEKEKFERQRVGIILTGGNVDLAKLPF